MRIDLASPLLRAVATSLWVLSGVSCSHPRLSADLPDLADTPDRPGVAETLTTAHYRVTTDAGHDPALAVARLMEAAYPSYAHYLGHADAPPPLQVTLYSTVAAFRASAAKAGLADDTLSGFYNPTEPAGIHVSLAEIDGAHPYFSLVHEGAHQYAHQVGGHGLACRVAGREQAVKLPALPLWQNEGVALYLEAALIDGTTLRPGRIHPERLAHLQDLLKRKEAPPAFDVITRRYGQAFGNNDYSVAWGLVHYLLNHPLDGQTPWDEYNERLRARTEAAAARLSRAGCPDGRLALQADWAALLAELSQTVFVEAVVAPAAGHRSWEHGWHEYVLGLSAD